jgi:hypothetical protein
MDPSSIVRSPAGQRGSGTHRDQAMAPARQYRRQRQHLYPLDDYEAALATGGIVSSFCGIEADLPGGGDGGDVVEVDQPEASDCVTCVDIWRGHRLVRL